MEGPPLLPPSPPPLLLRFLSRRGHATEWLRSRYNQLHQHLLSLSLSLLAPLEKFLYIRDRHAPLSLPIVKFRIRTQVAVFVLPRSMPAELLYFLYFFLFSLRIPLCYHTDFRTIFLGGLLACLLAFFQSKFTCWCTH